jgi:glycosyltransferase involved in cell wall biosynthesis
MRILMLLHKSVEHDSRVRREGRALVGAGHEVVVLHAPREAGLGEELDGFGLRAVMLPGWARRLPAVVRRGLLVLAFVRELRRVRPDAVHAHDVAMLGPGAVGARLTGARLVYDSHEYAVGVPYRERLWAWLVSALERVLIGRADAVIAVSDGIAERLRERYGLAELPAVVRNLPDPEETDPGFEAPDLRAELGIAAEAPLVLHLGAVARDRGGETLVRAVARVPGAHLLFLGADDSGFAAGLEEVARNEGTADRVHLRPSVPVGQIRAYTRQASVGVTLLEDTCDNHRLALPNKLFEYLAAEVPVVASDLPEMRRALAGRPATALVDPADSASVAAGIEAVLRDEVEVPPSPFEWEEDARHLVGLYARLGQPAGRHARTEPGPRRALILVRNGVVHDARVMREARLLDSLGYETTVAGVRTGAGAEPPRVEGAKVVWLDPGGGLRALVRRVRSRLASPSSNGDRQSAPASRRSDTHTVPNRGLASQPQANLRSDTSAVSDRKLAEAASAARVQLTPYTRVSCTLDSTTARLRRLVTTGDYYRRGIGLVRRTRPALIHANDYNTAWIGLAGKVLTGSRFVYDSHELWPDRNLRPEWRPWLLLCEALFVRAADSVITTSPGYAEVIAGRYRVPPPTVVRNLPEWRAEPVAPRAGEGPLAVYFGAVTRNRGLPAALRALALAPELRLRIVGPEAWGYRATLAELAAELGVADRLELLDPVAPEEAPSVLADADVGLALIEPACLSYEMTLPNKLYEYAAAGLPVLCSEIPVLAREVREHGIGAVADPADPAAVAAALRAMLEPEANARFREAARLLAAEATWTQEREKLAAVYGAAGADR